MRLFTNLGSLIRSKRKDRNLTQTQLAELLGVNQVAVSDWETGKATPRNLRHVTEVLEITEDEVMAAFAAFTENDPVAQQLMATTKISAAARDAMLTLYREARQAHEARQQTNET